MSWPLIAANFTRGLTELSAWWYPRDCRNARPLSGRRGRCPELTQLGTIRRGIMTGVTILGGIYGVWTIYGAGPRTTHYGERCCWPETGVRFI